ncbi:MAG: glycosyltransferase family 4 protein [Candidatus Aenigmarchaeota archaeon]|nr:glycosyltransferase family 4 protein [Candidatus Aenigmarchaeota archaeon]
MKVLHITHAFYPSVGGLELHIEKLSRELGCDVLTVNKKAERKLPSYENYKGIKVYRLPFLNLRHYKIFHPKILSIIKNYDVLHIHNLGFISDFVGLTKFIHKKPIILSTHGGIFHTKNMGFLKKIYFNLWCRFIFRYVDKVIANSKNDKILFSDISKNITYISDAVDFEKFSSIKRKPDENIFLSVGRVAKNKRIDLMIETFFHIQKKKPNAKLFVIGDFYLDKGNFTDMIKSKGLEKSVFLLGKVPEEDILKHMEKAGFFLSSSEYEGFGISVMEAMAAGIPVIVNDIDAFRNFVMNGKNGFLIDYFKPKDAADSILEIMKKDNSNISKESRKTAKKYDWDIIIEKLKKTYESVDY